MRGAKSDSPVSTWLHSLTLTVFAVLCALGVKTNRACNRAGKGGGIMIPVRDHLRSITICLRFVVDFF